MGTAYYVAPEVMKQDYDKKADIWSIGVIMYLLLCGRPPFDGRTDQEIISNVSQQKLKFTHKVWYDISDEAKDLVK